MTAADFSDPSTTTGMRARKAVIPAAGLGTRFLPATKAVPKELLPVVDVPGAGVHRGRGRPGRAHGRPARSPTRQVRDRGPLRRRAGGRGRRWRRRATSIGWRASGARPTWPECTSPDSARPAGSATRSPTPKRSSATSRSRCCSATTSSTSATCCWPPMLDVQAEQGGIVVGLIEVGGSEICSTAASSRPARSSTGSSPSRPRSRSRSPTRRCRNLAVIGRYVLPPEIFDALGRTEPGARGELELTDAMRVLGQDGVPDTRRRLPRPPLRHRRPAGLPEGGRPAGRVNIPRWVTILGLAGRLRPRSGVDDARRPSTGPAGQL